MLINSRAGGPGLAALAKCQTLRRLALTDQRVTKSDLEAIATIGQLTQIELTGIQEIADQDLLALAPLKDLESAIFHRCPLVTDAGPQLLRQALPACRVDHSQPYGP